MSEYTKSLIKAILIRAGKTFCQTLVGAIGGAAIISEVNWLTALSAAALAAIISVLMNIGGVPEVEDLTGGGKVTVTLEAGDEGPSEEAAGEEGK